MRSASGDKFCSISLALIALEKLHGASSYAWDIFNSLTEAEKAGMNGEAMRFLDSKVQFDELYKEMVAVVKSGIAPDDAAAIVDEFYWKMVPYLSGMDEFVMRMEDVGVLRGMQKAVKPN